MKVLLSLLALASLAPGWALQGAPAPVRESQQFKVIDARPVSARSPGPLLAPSGEALVNLDADVLLLSAERIRDVLLDLLGMPHESGRRIRLVLYLAQTPSDLIRIASTHAPDGWDYEVQIPDQIERQKLIGGIVGILLLEASNRGQGPKSAEIPLWLVEGLSMHVAAVGGPDLVLGAVPVGTMLRIVRVWRGIDRRLDYLKEARVVLRSQPPLSFANLAHPRLETLTGEGLKVYRASSHLFLAELLDSEGGAAGLRRMLRELPRCWNWETAFLRSFPGQFRRMLDVEKWWSVNLLAFIARDPSQVWSEVACLDQLDAVLKVPAMIRLTPDTMPVRDTLTLQQVITNWDFASQVPALRLRLSQLAALRFHSTRQLLPVISGYETVLVTYLQNRFSVNRKPATRMQPTFNASLVAREAIDRLEALDRQRQGLRPEQALSSNSKAGDRTD